MDLKKLAIQSFEAGLVAAWEAFERAAETVTPGGFSHDEKLRFQLPVGRISARQTQALRAAYDQGVQIGVFLAWTENPEVGIPLVFSSASAVFADGSERDIPTAAGEVPVKCVMPGCTNTTYVEEGAPATKLCVPCFRARFEG